jgi:mRNA interferase YafQ
MTLRIFTKKQFEKDLKKQKKRGKNLAKFAEVAKSLVNEIPLSGKYRNHKLIGNFSDRWECHIEPDWLLIYKKTDKELIFERTGSHSDLFK